MEADKSLNKIDPAGVNSGQEPEKEQTTERQETQEQAEQKDIQQEQEKQSPHSEEDQAKIADMTKRHIEWEKLIQSQREGYGNGAMLPSVGKIMRVFPKGQSVGAMLGMVKQIADDGKSVIMQLVNGSYYRFDLTDIQITKSAVIQLLIQKAKRRNVGEVWTQASGRRVTKKAQGKIVEVKGRKQELEQSKKGRVHAAVKNQQSLNFAKKETVNQEKEVKPVNRGSEISSHKVIGSATEKASAKVTTGINTHVGEVHHELNTSHLNPRQAANAKEIHEKLKNLPESELRTRLERLKKLPNNGGAAGITAINHILNRPQASSETKTEVQEKVTGVNKVDDSPKEQPKSEEHAKEIKSAKVKEAVKAKKAEMRKASTPKDESALTVEERLQKRAFESESLEDFRSKILGLVREGYQTETLVRNAMGISKVYRDKKEHKKIKDFYEKHRDKQKKQPEQEPQKPMMADEIIKDALAVWDASSKLPEGSFKNAFVSTGVNTRMIVIDKPSEPTSKPENKIDTFPESEPLIDKKGERPQEERKEKTMRLDFEGMQVYETLEKLSIDDLKVLEYPELRRIAGLGFMKMDKGLLNKINQAFSPLLKNGDFPYDSKESAIQNIVKFTNKVIESDQRKRPHTEQEYRDVQAYRHGYGNSVMNRDI